MIFVTGPLYAGKSEYIRAALGLTEAELAARSVRDAYPFVRISSGVPSASMSRMAVRIAVSLPKDRP